MGKRGESSVLTSSMRRSKSRRAKSWRSITSISCSEKCTAYFCQCLFCGDESERRKVGRIERKERRDHKGREEGKGSATYTFRLSFQHKSSPLRYLAATISALRKTRCLVVGEPLERGGSRYLSRSR